MIAALASVLVLVLVLGGALIVYELRALHRELDAIDPMRLTDDCDRISYVRLYRKWGWTPRVDPWTGELLR